ncbi:MAG: PKD domain-containing protein [Solirubrobacteraceae bacterium]|nr:PKD domain-containing protein [Solirubrobacteraceae bacterium]
MAAWAPAALVVAATLVPPAPVLAADPALRLRLDGNSLVVPPSTLGEPDVPRDRPVTIRTSSSTKRDQAGGTSLRKLLDLVGINADTVTSIGVQADAGLATAKEVKVSGDEVRGGFSGDPLCPACAATLDAGYGQGTVNFFRPLRSGTDVNGPDQVQPAVGRTLFVRVESSAPRIAINLDVSNRTPKPAETVTLRASLPAGGSPALTWYFGDGTTAPGGGPTVTHSYLAGSWTVGVLATDGTGYGSAAAVISVGAPASNDGPTPTGAPKSGSGGPSGSKGSGGSGGGTGKSKGGGGPDAASDGARDPETDGDKPSRSTDGGATPAPTAAVAATATPAAAAATTPASATPAPTSSPSPTPAPLIGTGTGVSGVLIERAAAIAPLTGALAAADALAQDAQPESQPERSGASGGRSIVRSAASGILLLGILGAGALTELRRSRRTALLP